jgi:hypothetical protein
VLHFCECSNVQAFSLTEVRHADFDIERAKDLPRAVDLS